MKTGLLTIALIGTTASVYAQGTLNFANGGPGLQAKVTDTDGVGLFGGAWLADLYWAAGVVTDSTLLIALGAPSIFSTHPSQAGFFFGGPRTIPTAPGVITAQVRVFDNNCLGDPCVLSLVGESILFQVTLADPNAAPPEIPTTMTGLNGHPFQVGLIPEPSVLALAGLGLAGMLVLRRRRKR